MAETPNERRARVKQINQIRNTRRMIMNGATPSSELMLNAMTSRSDLMQKLFDPRRDINEECGYPVKPNQHQYREMYRRELGRRVVDVYPSETWKVFPTIYEDPDPENETDFEIALDALNNKRQLMHYLQRIDELSGIGYYGVILWGINDGLPLHQPVEGHEQWEEATGEESTYTPPERSLMYIRVLDESLVNIASYESDVTNPRYGLPTHYNIQLSDPQSQESDAVATEPNNVTLKVHWSRVTHVADNRKTSEVLGSPRMEPVWNRLYDLRKILAGSGEMFWKGGFPGISLETQPGLENAELDEDATQDAMYNYMNGMQRYIALTGMSAKSLAPQIADPTSSFEAHVKAICVTLGVPFRVFMGIEEGVVSGDQATKAWETRLQNRQARYVTPMIINPVIQRLIDLGVLPAPDEEMGWTVEWPPMMDPSALEQAEVANKKTEALAKYIQGQVDALIPPMEYLTGVLGYDTDEAASILEEQVRIMGVNDDPEDTKPAGKEPQKPKSPQTPGK